MIRFLIISLFCLCALYRMAGATERIDLGEDLVVKTSPVFRYDVQSLCSQTAELAKQAQFQKPQGNWNSDFMLVDKSRRILHLMSSGKIFRSYHVALGSQPVGKKRQEGDNKTPEGLYSIGHKNSGSSYHLSLAVDYPNQADIDWARAKGVDPGGDIMIHGLPNATWQWPFLNHPNRNWTKGCVAVTNSEIEEIWEFVKEATLLELCP